MLPPLPYVLSPPPPHLQPAVFNLDKVSPTILLVIIILSVIFFVSSLLHLLFRFLVKQSQRDPDDIGSATALQGQLQQLFHLHDAGMDQSFIDSLPVFDYKSIMGSKSQFDCVVCLCEFEDEDKLRLLPKCSHAFHMECIDTWLLSHSTCPLCRASLLPDLSSNHGFSPIVLVLEAGSESSREMVNDRDRSRTSSNLRSNSNVSERKDDAGETEMAYSEEKIVPVILGKLRNGDAGGSTNTGNGKEDARRCFSMGSFEYVMAEDSSLRVSVRTPLKKQHYRAAMSEHDCESRRDFDGFEEIRIVEEAPKSGKLSNVVEGSKRESFSVSKFWLRKEKVNSSARDSSRRAFSFRFPVSRNEFSGDDMKAKSSEAKESSFAKKTLHWLPGKQNTAVHPSFSPNV